MIDGFYRMGSTDWGQRRRWVKASMSLHAGAAAKLYGRGVRIAVFAPIF